MFGLGLLAAKNRLRAQSGLSREKRTLMRVKLTHTRFQFGSSAQIIARYRGWRSDSSAAAEPQASTTTCLADAA